MNELDDLDEIARLRCFPSMPEERQASCLASVDPDGVTRLRLDLAGEVLTLTAPELSMLIYDLVSRRADMGPPFSNSPHAEASWTEADAYALGDGKLDAIGHVWSRVPGFGWVHLAFSAHAMRELAASILMLSNPDDVPSQKH